MNTEITDTKAEKVGRGVEGRTPAPEPPRGWVLYDGDCHICTGTVRRWGDALKRRGFECVPLQTNWVRERLNLSEHELMLEMRVLEPSGKVVGAAAALLLLARTFWWALPLVWLAKVPGVFPLLDAAYRWGAARRYCSNLECGGLTPLSISDASKHPNVFSADGMKSGVKPPHSKFVRWCIALLTLCAPFMAWHLPGWLFMWIMAGALWFALKLFIFVDARPRNLKRSLAYFAWPGMDAPEFFDTAQPIRRDWFSAVLNIALGTALVYAGARAAYPYSELLAGWVAMVGIVLVLHFGIFKCLALLWRATPIMDAPLRSRSLSEFWGRRWNTGFSIPARRYLMEPLARRFGTTAGLLAVFLVSGLVHELVISLPAKAGYGLPTLYFLIQAAALVIERKRGSNRFWTLVCVAAPAFILFHPPFVHRVIIPFLNVIGAL